ncbi:MAG TPA: hypothetical protein VGB87_12275 [Vicinamibacteria bacterium]
MGARTNPADAKISTAAFLFAVGFLAMLGQVVLLRELAVASFGVELIYLLGLSLWLAAGAAGAVLGRLGGPGPSSRTGAVFLLVAALIPLELTFLRGARLLFGGVSGAFLPLGQQVAAAALGLAPAGAVLGLLFLLAARRSIAAGGSLAAAYAWESAGGALGSVAATLALHWGVPNVALGLGCGLAGAGAAAAAGSARRWAVPVIAVLLALLAMSGPLDRLMTTWNHRDLLETADTPYGRVTISRAAGQLTLFENDAVAFESEGTEAEEIVHLSAPQAPAAPLVLMIGGGVAGIAAEVLKHGPARVDYVESNRGMYRALLPHLSPEARRALESETVRVVFADPRRFLSSAASYDLILIASPEPSSGQSNRFYTREFFRLCAARLSPGGVVALRLPSSENFWTPRLVRRNGSVHAALAAVFPDVLVLPGSTDTLLASKARLSRDPGVLADRLRERGIAARLVTPAYLRYLLTNDRLEQVAGLLSGAGAPPNSDGTPVCYRETAFLWLGKFIPALDRAGPPDRRAGIWLLGLAGAALLFARLRPARRRAALAAVAGFAGMVAEGVVLLRYQAESGALYQDIGLLLTAFMAGLAAGAFAFDRAAAGTGRVGRTLGAALLGGLALLLGGVALAAAAGGAWFRLGPAAALLAASGALVSGVFGYASRLGGADQENAAAPVYAADLLGGCLGSVLAGLLLVPLLGAGATAAGTAIVAAAALILL